MPKISVAIPTYGRESVLIDTVEQVLNQSERDLELIVADQTILHEQSTEKYFKSVKDSRLKYFRISPPSLPAARNFLIEKSTSDIILFLDDDIVIDKHFVANHLMAMNKDSKIGAVGGRVINKHNTQKLVKKPLYFDQFARGHGTFNCDVSQFGSSFPGGNMAIRASVMKAVGGFDTSYKGSSVREESDMAYRIARQGAKIHFEANASLIHLAAPSGGTRVSGDPLDGVLFYINDLLFTLKTVRPLIIIVSLAAKYRDALRAQPLATKLRRTGLFFWGLAIASKYLMWPATIVAKEVKN